MKNKINFTAICSSSFPSSFPNFFTATNSTTVRLSTGKIQLIKAELTFKPNFERIELPYIECVNAVALTVADPHSGSLPTTTGLSRQAQCETNFNFPAPPFNHISGIC